MAGEAGQFDQGFLSGAASAVEDPADRSGEDGSAVSGQAFVDFRVRAGRVSHLPDSSRICGAWLDAGELDSLAEMKRLLAEPD